jgi:hypothetical protein
MHGKGRVAIVVVLVAHGVLISLASRSVRFRVGSYSFVENRTSTYGFEEHAKWVSWVDVPPVVLHTLHALAAIALQIYPYGRWLLVGISVNKTLAAWALCASLGVQDAAVWFAAAATSGAFAVALQALVDVTGTPSMKRSVLNRVILGAVFTQATHTALLASRAADAWSALAATSDAVFAGAVTCAYAVQLVRHTPPTGVVCFTVAAQALAVGWFAARPRLSPEAAAALTLGVVAAVCAAVIGANIKSDTKKSHNELPYTLRPDGGGAASRGGASAHVCSESRYGYELRVDEGGDASTKKKKKKNQTLEEKLMAANLVPDRGSGTPSPVAREARSERAHRGRDGLRDDAGYADYGGSPGADTLLESSLHAADAYPKRTPKQNMTFLI